MPSDQRRAVPRPDRLLADERLAEPRPRLGDRLVKYAVHHAQARMRSGKLAGEDAVDAVPSSLRTTASSLRPVLNATGGVLHTNLGRAPLSSAAVEPLVDAAGYVDVEFAAALRAGGPPVVARVERERWLIDLGCVPPAEDVRLREAELTDRRTVADRSGPCT